mgnify:CR=1 FL=1
MNYKVKAIKVFSINNRTQIEDYEREVLNYSEALKEKSRLQILGNYSNIQITKIHS